jgi:hypothetical protein
MTWWDISLGRGVTGDQPAEIVSGLFADLERAHSENELPKPTFQAILDGAATALRRHLHELVDRAGPSAFQALHVELATGDWITSDDRDSDDPLLVETCRRHFLEVARAYEATWERKPTVHELAYALCHALRKESCDCVSDPESARIHDIYAK